MTVASGTSSGPWLVTVIVYVDCVPVVTLVWPLLLVIEKGASMVEPGVFPSKDIDAFSTPGLTLFTEYILPIEMVAILLLVALIGALLLLVFRRPVGDLAFAQQVHGHHGKLPGRPPLEKQHGVVVIQAHERTDIRFRLFLHRVLDEVVHRIVGFGHLDIGQYNRRPFILENLQGFHAIFGSVDLIAEIGQRDAEDLANPLFIIDE